MADESIIANLKSQGFDELIKNLDASAKGFTLLETTIGEAQKKLNTLDKNSQDFKDLTKEINATKTAMDAYSQSTDTLKKDLRTTTDEIGKMERALQELEKTGQKNTQTYKDIATAQSGLKEKAGQLKDTIGDLNAEIKNSGSDTKNLDKALRAINTVASGYQAAQGALVLFGGENKKFEQTLLKLNAVMAITQGLQQIQEELSKKDSIFTALATKAKIAYTSATTTASGAVNGLRLAMLALGAGAVIVVLATIAYNWDKITRAIGGADSRFQDYIDKYELMVKGSKRQLESFDLEEKKLKLIGVSEERILDLREQKIKQVLRGLKLQLLADDQALKSAIVSNAKLTALKNLPGGVGLVASLFYTTDSDLKKLQEGNESLKAEIEKYEGDVLDIKLKAKDKDKKEDKKSKVDELKDELDKQLQLRRKSDIERRDLEAKHQKALEEQQKLESEKRKLDLRKEQSDIEKIESENIDKRLKANKELQDKLAEQNKARQEADLESKRLHEEKVQNIISTVYAAFDAATSIASQVISVKAERELQALEDKKQKGLISEKQYQKESAKIKNDAAEKQRAVDIAMALAQVPLVVLNALSTAPNPIVGGILAGIAGGLALAQVAILAASPLPKFAKGVIDLKDNKAKDGVDTVPALLSKGESVMTVEETREHKAVLQAIRNKTFNKLFVPANMVKQADIFANIPTPANMEIKALNDDYSSINDRLDETNNKLWWLTNAIKEGNKQRVYGNQKIITNLKPRYVG